MHDYYVGVWHDLKQRFSQARLLYMYIFFLYVFFRNFLYCPELFYHFYMTNFPHVSQKKIIENVNRDWVFQLFNYVGFLELNLMIDYSTIKSLLLTPTMLASPWVKGFRSALLLDLLVSIYLNVNLPGFDCMDTKWYFIFTLIEILWCISKKKKANWPKTEFIFVMYRMIEWNRLLYNK